MSETAASSSEMKDLSSTVDDGKKANVLKPLLITIEGTMGAGKSYLLKNLLARNPDWTFIDEPVDDWLKMKNENNDSIFELFFKEMRRWSYTFQTCALMTRHQNIETAVEKIRNQGVTGVHVFITERSVESCDHVFTKLLIAQGMMDKLEVDLFHLLLKQTKAHATPLSGIVYLSTSPALCDERIKKRNRAGEDDVPMDYLNDFHNMQQNWINGETVIPKLTVENNDDTQLVEDFVHSLVKNI